MYFYPQWKWSSQDPPPPGLSSMDTFVLCLAALLFVIFVWLCTLDKNLEKLKVTSSDRKLDHRLNLCFEKFESVDNQLQWINRRLDQLEEPGTDPL